MEKGGIPSVLVTSFPDIAENQGVPRIVHAFGITWPFGNPYLPLSEEKAIRRSVLERCLYALTQTPVKPTVYWGNYGNCIGDQESVGYPTIESCKDWDWTIRQKKEHD